MTNKPDITARDIHAYIDRLEAENKALKEQQAHMVDASRYSRTAVSFAEAARIIGIKLNTLEGYIEQGIIKRMACTPRAGKDGRQICLQDILELRGGKTELRKISRKIAKGHYERNE